MLLQVFEDTQPVVVSVLDGFNVCIFAYGQVCAMGELWVRVRPLRGSTATVRRTAILSKQQTAGGGRFETNPFVELIGTKVSNVFDLISGLRHIAWIS